MVVDFPDYRSQRRVHGKPDSRQLASMIGLMYFAIAAIYVAPAIFLNRYASGIAALLRTNRSSDLEQALRSQKSFWKFIGILMLVILSIYAVIALVAVIAAIMR